MDYINNTISNLQQICFDCQDCDKADCIKAKCNVGFALRLVDSIKKTD